MCPYRQAGQEVSNLPGKPSDDLPEDAPLVAAWRGELVQSIHWGRVAVCDPTGEVIEAVGDLEGYVYAFCVTKPFQALPLVLSGAADSLELTDEELAVVCASHNAEEPHLTAIRSILEKANLSEADLQCGKPEPIHSMCSGKHAGMLALCVHEGWTTESYRDPDHPAQRLILETMARVCNLRRDEIVLGGDGCGVPGFGMPLKNLATGFARLATGENLPDDLADAAGRVWQAMRGHPYMVAGRGRLDTSLMQAANLVSKIGLEGVFAAGSPDGWGFALKISDGAGRAVTPAALAALARRGLVAPEEQRVHLVRDRHGKVVGRLASFL